MQAKNYGRVAVIMGGDTPEREVSFLSGNAVLAALLRSGIDAYAFDPLIEPLENLQKYGCDKAFVMVHGKNGEDGKLQGALECLKIPYTGSGVMASSIGMDKYRTKLIWQACGIPMAKSQLVEKDKYLRGDFSFNLQLPVVVKSADDGSTLGGFERVFQLDKLDAAIKMVLQSTKKVLVEEMIVGDEFTITIMDGKVYPIIKIEAPDGDYNFENKYYSDDTKYLCKYDLGELQAKLEKWALLGYDAIGAVGVARSDFMIDKEGEIYFLEINTLPGMTGHSLVPQSLAAAGIDFDQLCLMILDGAGLAK